MTHFPLYFDFTVFHTTHIIHGTKTSAGLIPFICSKDRGRVDRFFALAIFLVSCPPDRFSGNFCASRDTQTTDLNRANTEKKAEDESLTSYACSVRQKVACELCPCTPKANNRQCVNYGNRAVPLSRRRSSLNLL